MYYLINNLNNNINLVHRPKKYRTDFLRFEKQCGSAAKSL